MHCLTFSRSAAPAWPAFLVTLFAAFAVWVGGGVAAGQDFEGKKISAVEIRYRGPKTVDEARLRNFMTVKGGDTYSTEKLDNDIRALYESGLVDDVRFLAEPVGGEVKLIAELTTRPPLVAVGFVGNTVFSSEKLAKETKLKAGGAMSDEQILQARRNIEKYYEGYGYPDVVVSHRIQPSEQSGGSDLVFVIEEGGKNEVRKIRFEGNASYPAPELRKHMKTKEKGIFSWLTKSGRFESEQLDEDLEAVLDFYRNEGFLRVSSPGIRREPVGDGRVDLVIPVNEGARYRVASVGFGRMTQFKPEELYPALTLAGGMAYSAEKMRADITMIRDYYGSRGFADAAVTPDISNAGESQVNIIYRVTEGGRYRVGEVNIEGRVKTQDKVIRREIPLKPGEYFNSVELDTTRSRLKNLNYFNDVQVTTNPGRSGYRDINVLVEEKKTGALNFGVGFSSIDSIVGYVTFEQSNFDIRNPFQLEGGGAGQRFSASLRAGSERRDFSLSLVEPWFMDRQLSLGGELYYRDAYYYSDVYDQTNVGGAVTLRWPFGDKGAFKAEYRLENIEIDLDSLVPAGSWFQGTQGDYLRSQVGFSYEYDSRDSNILPRTGEKVEVSTTLAGGIFGGDVDTYSFRASGIKHWNLWWDSILTLNGEFATVDSIDGGKPVPVFDLYALGGARTLRGFDYRDVGPRDPVTGEVYGGQSLGFMSLEYTVPLIENVRAAVFYDMGFVNANAWDLSASDLHSDVGIGLRLFLPMGPLALDYAFPVSSPDARADNGGQFQFYLNYQF